MTHYLLDLFAHVGLGHYRRSAVDKLFMLATFRTFILNLVDDSSFHFMYPFNRMVIGVHEWTFPPPWAMSSVESRKSTMEGFSVLCDLLYAAACRLFNVS